MKGVVYEVLRADGEKRVFGNREESLRWMRERDGWGIWRWVYGGKGYERKSVKVEGGRVRGVGVGEWVYIEGDV